jgi:tRNA (guanine37-N1)-methyltransferase
VRTAYDIVGSIAIIDIMPELESKEQLIGQKIMENNKTVKTVLKKVGGHEGVYRTQAMACIAGEDTRETMVIENGIRLRVNVENSYYSIRMATERKRIAQLIQPGERVLCLFSGIGPYPITFSMHTPASDLVGVEINPKAHELAVENVARNRCLNVRLFCGDAHDIIPKLAENKEVFDRITMPLPHTADEFLDDLMAVVKPGTVIHYYTFLEEDQFNNAIPKLRQIFARRGYALARYDVVRAGQHAPRIWRICVDAEIARI